MAYDKLFSPYQLGNLELKNRVVMAPMTRARTTQPGNIPNDLMGTYYAQRTQAGLIITEATQISQQGQGYSFTPGIHTPEHIQGWRRVTEKVHANGGKIYLQLWHVGRMSHSSFHKDGKPVAPSAIAPEAKVWVVNAQGQGEMVDCPVPRALEADEIPGIVAQFRQGARNAITAGFDGVEIHGANGYLIDQFLRKTSNIRTDEYGGNLENRLRFPVQVVKAVIEEVGAERTGLRLAPFIKQRGMDDDQIHQTFLALAEKVQELKLSYLHFSEADWEDAPQVPEDFRKELRHKFHGTVIVAGQYTPERAEAILEKGYADLVAFGRPFIANPDYPARIREGRPLKNLDPTTLFGGTAHGYTDY